MNRVTILILVAIATVFLVLFIQRPELVEKIGLWILGFIGIIVRIIEEIVDYVKKRLNPDTQKKNKGVNPVSAEEGILSNPGVVSNNVRTLPQTANDHYNGLTISLMRFADDGQTTMGLLYLDGKFFCYTLEDTHHDVKIPGQTRIPAGTYELQLRMEETDLTKRYQTSFPDWFTYHLQLRSVPQFSGVYIHSGGDHTDTEGCILVSDSVKVEDAKTFLINSRNTFKRLYLHIRESLQAGIPVHMIIKDEHFIQQTLKAS